MEQKKKVIIIILVIAILGLGFFAISRKSSNKKAKSKIDITNDNKSQKTYPIANEGNVSPISGLACENWNRRPIAVMQPADVPARPAAGFFDADMVIEMPVITASITRLMGVYVCGNPDDVGSMRSARHDFVNLAKGLDAIFVHWGRSDIQEFKDRLNGGIIDNINCNGDAGKSANACPDNPCYRKHGMARGVDSGYAKFSKIVQCAKDFGYRMDNKFVGYPHQGEAPMEERVNGGKLRVAFAGPFAAEYEYDKNSNSYLRYWGDVLDSDRNNKNKITPKNIVVVFATSEQIEGQYNNVQLGDPWYDTSDSGEARYYMNGREVVGTWKKDKSNIENKLFFYDSSGEEIKFVPGQIWVEILEPGQNLKWEVK